MYDYDDTFRDLVCLASILLLWLTAMLAAEIHNLSEQRTLRRRERYRGRAFAEMDRKRMLKQNRDALWQEVERL